MGFCRSHFAVYFNFTWDQLIFSNDKLRSLVRTNLLPLPITLQGFHGSLSISDCSGVLNFELMPKINAVPTGRFSLWGWNFTFRNFLHCSKTTMSYKCISILLSSFFNWVEFAQNRNFGNHCCWSVVSTKARFSLCSQPWVYTLLFSGNLFSFFFGFITSLNSAVTSDNFSRYLYHRCDDLTIDIRVHIPDFKCPHKCDQ